MKKPTAAKAGISRASTPKAIIDLAGRWLNSSNDDFDTIASLDGLEVSESNFDEWAAACAEQTPAV